MGKILIACEESQIVCKEFRNLGHLAFSCDILPCSGGHPEWHIQDNVLYHLHENWDLMIAHPPCTYLCNAGIRWFNEQQYGHKAKIRKNLRDKAYKFVMKLINSNIPKIALENPVGYLNSHYRKPDQIIQPYYFGNSESKRTCLWLKNLPPLHPTLIVTPKIYGYYKKGPKKGQKIYWSYYISNTKNRTKLRSKTFVGIAKAMASQWGCLL